MPPTVYVALIWSTHARREIGRLLQETMLTKYSRNWFDRDNPVEATELPSTIVFVCLLFMSQICVFGIFLLMGVLYISI